MKRIQNKIGVLRSAVDDLQQIGYVQAGIERWAAFSYLSDMTLIRQRIHGASAELDTEIRQTGADVAVSSNVFSAC
jgi:hypothetical protein